MQIVVFMYKSNIMREIKEMLKLKLKIKKEEEENVYQADVLLEIAKGEQKVSTSN